MKSNSITLSLAALSLSLAVPGFGQVTSTTPLDEAQTQTTPQTIAPGAEDQAQHMVAAQATLEGALDARKDMVGSTFKAKLGSAVHLDNGTEIPKGSVLMGQVVDDDMNAGSNSKLALRFTQAALKDGTVVPVRATIVGMYPPPLDTEIIRTDEISKWTPRVLVMDQVGVLKGVDLHSRIGGRNSGTLVSSTKSEMKLQAGSQFALAIGPAPAATASTQTPAAR